MAHNIIINKTFRTHAFSTIHRQTILEAWCEVVGIISGPNALGYVAKALTNRPGHE
jgi:hypothetical protein